jgi:Arc/MetJ family transcription regulator
MSIDMRTTLNIDDQLIKRAVQLTGVQEKTQLLRLGLEALISREAAKRLARLGGSEPHLEVIRRRRPA